VVAGNAKDCVAYVFQGNFVLSFVTHRLTLEMVTLAFEMSWTT